MVLHRKAIAYLVHNYVINGVLLRILVVAEPEAETLRIKAFKVLHKQKFLSIFGAQELASSPQMSYGGLCFSANHMLA